MNSYVEEALQKQVYEGFDYSDPEFIRGLFEQTDEWRNLPKDKYAICLVNAPLLPESELFDVLDRNDVDENYKDAVVRAFTTRDSVHPPVLAQVLEDNSYCGTPGTISSHVVDVTVKGTTIPMELPEVQVWSDVKPYVKRIQNAEQKTIEKELWKVLCYVYRLGMDDRAVVTAGIERGIEYKRIKAIQLSAAKKSIETKTIDDLYLVDWFERAVKHCNSWGQVNVLIHVYVEAVTYCTIQPAISKQRLAEKAGVDRKVIRRLFERLEKAGVLVEGPESMKEWDKATKTPLSNPRIVNLNPAVKGRWEGMNLKPAPNRNKAKKAIHTFTPATEENRSYVDSQGSNEADFSLLVGNKSWEEAEPT